MKLAMQPTWAAKLAGPRELANTGVASFAASFLVAAVLWLMPGSPLAVAQTGIAVEGKPVLPAAQFVGSSACSQCHPAEHKAWTGSHHAAAMQEANDKTVQGRFDGSVFTKDGIPTTFFKRGAKFWVRTDGPDGKTADFEVKYTFGITPLQQYLIELPGGRLQALGIAWDSRAAVDGGQRWFHLYPDRHLRAGDPLHWTGIDQNWNYQCAWCHSTNLRKNYDAKSRTFKTEWSEINVGCEACHGPASNHMAWASKSRQYPDEGKGFEFKFDERGGVGWRVGETGRATRSQAPRSGIELKICAGCHARRGQFSDNPSEVRSFFDAFRAARVEPPLYHTDGQQRDEVFNYASFLQSKMHAAGVICSDCHNPHSGKLRLEGNSVCTQCHAPDRFDVPGHHHHAAGSAGVQCIACHMPTTVYMGVDARHDHSMRIPRPDRTHVLATPNACNQCHADRSAQWAADAVKSWFPSPIPGGQTFSEAFDLGDRGAPGAQSALTRVFEDSSLSGIVRASAIARLGRYPSRSVGSVLATALKAKDPHIRSAAVTALSGATAATRQTLLVPMLRDDTRLVRMDAARELAGDAERGLSREDRQLFEKALAEYIVAQMFNAERPESRVNLGSTYLRRGMIEEARSEFSEAIAIDPSFVPAAISLADLERAVGNESASEAVLLTSIVQNPTSGALYHALGLSLVRQQRHAQALDRLADAARLAPEQPRFAYVHAVAVHGAGKVKEAVETLKSALLRHPYDREILMALISYEMERGDRRSALERAELMAQLEPERADVPQLVERIRRGLR